MQRPTRESGTAVSSFHRACAWLGRPMVLRRSYVHIHAIGCSAEELAELARLDSAELDRLEHVIRRLTGSSRSVGRLTFYCLGSKRASEKVSSILGTFADGMIIGGAWSPDDKIGAFRLAAGMRVHSVVVHEATHALLDTLTGGFRYPLAISEGFAALMERMIPHVARPACNTTTVRGCLATQCFLIEDLLRYQEATEMRSACYSALSRHALWLMQYLGNLGEGKGDIVKRMLGELRQANATSASRVYEWLLVTTGKSRDALEDGFLTYHTGKGAAAGNSTNTLLDSENARDRE